MTMSKKRIAIIISAIIVIVIGIVWYQSNENDLLNVSVRSESIAETDQSKFKVDQNVFQQIKDSQTIVLQDKNDVFKLNDDKYYVYFTKTECPFCEMLEPIIEYYTVNFNKPKIYFVDGDQCKELNIFVKKDDENSANISGYTLLGVPSMLVIENGELQTSLSGVEPINDELKKEALES